MPWYSVLTLIISVLTLFSVPTAIGLVWKDVHDKKKAENQEQKDKKHQEYENSLREIIREEIKPLCEELDKNTRGTKYNLKDSILRNYYECERKGYRNDYDYKDMHDLDDAYVELHGNSFVEDVMRRFDALPTKEEYDRIKEEENKNARNKKGGGIDGK